MKTRFNRFLTLLLAFVVQITFAQEKTISGVVSDESGPLPGVSILKKGTTQGTETDFDGNYSIKANSGDILVFSFVGMDKIEKTVGSSNKIDVLMSAAKSNVLNEVVVTALGIKREKKSIGYASQEIKATALTEGTTNTGNVASQFSGKVAGLNVTTTNNFGGSSNLVIRGIKSLGGGNPLIVIDGSPVNNSTTYSDKTNVDYGNGLSDINQEDIASINILKGAAASALYGERGLNGVIVITTKNGKSKDDKTWGVKYATNFTIGTIDKSTFPEYQTKYGAGSNQKFNSEPKDGVNYANLSDDASWGPKFNKDLLVYQWDSFDTTSPNYGKATPWVAAKNGPLSFFKTAYTFNNSISLQKGDKSKNIAFTYDNFESSGIMPNSKLYKNSLSLKANFDFTPKLHSSFYSSFTFQDTKGRNTTGYSNNIMGSFRQWWQVNVDLQDLKDAYFRNKAIASVENRYGNISWNLNKNNKTGAVSPAFWNNPYFQLYENYSSDNRFRTFNYARLTYDINDNINVTGKLSFDRSNLEIENRLAQGSLAQSFGQSNNEVGSGFSRRNITRQEINIDGMLNYKFDINENINVSGVAGGNIRKNYYNSIYASTEGGLAVPNLYALSNTSKNPLPSDEYLFRTESHSGYITASFDFYRMAYLDATFRTDLSSTLKDGQNLFSYPSVTGSFIVSEVFKPEWLSFWKVRLNYAEVGGTADPYRLKNSYTFIGLSNRVGIYRSTTIDKNENLKPQKSKEYEFGTEINLFKNRVKFDFAFYNTDTYNQILDLPISDATGYNRKIINAGQIRNSGLELQLGLTPYKTDDLTWNVDLNWSRNRNKVIKLQEGTDNYRLNAFQGGVTLNAFVGKAWGTLMGEGYKTDKNGNKIVVKQTYKDNNGKTYEYAKYDVVKNKNLGNSTPDWIGGIRNTLNYKNVSFSFLVDIRKGGKIFSTDMYYGLAGGLYKETANGDVRDNARILPGVFEDGTKNNLPSKLGNGSTFGYFTDPAEAFVYDGSFVKLREASIGYSVPKSFLKDSFFSDIKFSLVGRNLWIIHKNLPYADPEAMVGGGNNSYGLSIGSTPTTRNFGFNFTCKF